MEGLAGATYAFLQDPLHFLLFAAALAAGLVGGALPGLGAVLLSIIILPLTGSLSPQSTATVFGALFIAGVAGHWAARTDHEWQHAQERGGFSVGHMVLAGVVSALLVLLFAEGTASYVFFGFKAPEMFGVAFCALATVAGVAARQGTQGWLSLLLGLLLGLSIEGPITDGPRYIFGTLELLASISFVPLLVGFMVFPGAIQSIRKQPVSNARQFPGRLILTAATTNAALLPLVALGVPVSMGTVVLVAAMGLQGMEFGPLFIIEAEETAWALFSAALWASLLAPLIGNWLRILLSALQSIPASATGLALILAATAGVYAMEARMIDVYIMFGAGLAGYLLCQQGYSLVIIIMSIVLAQIVEPAYVGALGVLDGSPMELFGRPASAILIASGLLAMAVGAFWGVGRESQPDADSDGATEDE